MTVSETDRLHSQLSRFEDLFPGFRTEIVEGNIVMSPVRAFHAKTIRLVWNLLEPQLAPDWECVSDVSFPFSDEFEFCPDLAVIPAREEARNLSVYSPDLIELAMEVVSPGSVRNDYEIKDRQYAARGIAHYLIFDPRKGQVVTLWNPGPDGYRGRDTLSYGGKVSIDTAIGRLTLDTSALPVDPHA
ncbi:Uma2 family endonuclease [Streptomyces albipurpureus]|uniref:Uma2 family endonuclease n=1 Tax=Streptomyces albipurpureus TaxID=2897419 RepID=A0ABT0UZK1_9ACTN|nr:Uma2 family endonuclease [Streptomyces sp. CWNU-1]MCM2393993.1 Uma2 family endonuclease [Streptomyces sp. CWNU-1]